MKNLKVREKTIISLATAGIVTFALVARAGFYCASVDHEEEYCYLSSIFGLQHQADKINEGVNSFRYEAVYVPGDDTRVNGNEHVTEIVHSTWSNKNEWTVNSLSNLYYVDNGYLKEYEATGERVELYDTNDISGRNLIRVFQK